MSIASVLLPLVLVLQTGTSAPPKFTARLLAANESIAPGGRTDLLVEIDVAAEWHIYDPIVLDTGLPTEIEFTTPPGVTIGELRFPAPTLGETADLEYLEHSGKIRCLAPLTANTDIQPDQRLRISAKVSALACKVQCLPVEATAALTLPVTKVQGKPANEKIFKEARDELAPMLADASYLKGSELRVSKQKVAINDPAELIATIHVQKGHHLQDRDPGVEGLIPARLFIEKVPGIEFADEQAQIWPKPHEREIAGLGTVREQSGQFQIRVPFKITDPNFPSGPVTVRALFQHQVCTDAGTCYPPAMAAAVVSFEVDAEKVVKAADAETSGEPGASTALASPAPREEQDTKGSATDTDAPSLLWLFFTAFLGGIILNIMPCVLPVISLKVLGFMQQGGEDPRRVFRLGLTYGAGILASFLPIAIIMASAGFAWGGLMQSPAFMIGLTAVVFAFGLNLLGVFEIQLPGSAASAASDAASREGYPGAFLKGIMTTVLATPCTAPLLGSAVGLLTRYPPLVMGAGIMTVGVGLAAPYVLLTAYPGWLRFVPKPGPWMVTFRQIVGFILMAVVVWLFSILYELVGRAELLGGLVLLCAVALACWLLGRLDLSATVRKTTITWIGVVALVLAGWFGGARLFSQAWQKIPWQEWSPGRAEQLARDGYTVYVDYTATWCLTCQANKRFVLETDEIRKELSRLNVVPIKADFTTRDERMHVELQKHGRNGVPLNIVFPAGKPEEAIVLPEVLTQSIVIAALEKAGPSLTEPQLVRKER